MTGPSASRSGFGPECPYPEMETTTIPSDCAAKSVIAHSTWFSWLISAIRSSLRIPIATSPRRNCPTRSASS